MSRSLHRFAAVVPVVLVAVLVVGCGGDGVQLSTIPKTESKGGPGEKGDPGTGEYRILGGIFPADDPAWFFKFPGPSDALSKYEADFDKILASVTIPPNGDPQYDVPEGWKRGPGRAGIVVSTALTPDGKYEVALSSSRGGLTGNLERWAEQLGTPFGKDGNAKFTRPVDARGGVKGLRVDMRGPKKPPMGGGGPMMGGK